MSKRDDLVKDMDGQGARLIQVLLRDKLSSEIVGSRLIKRATLARCMRPTSLNPVTALNGMFVVEI